MEALVCLAWSYKCFLLRIASLTLWFSHARSLCDLQVFWGMCFWMDSISVILKLIQLLFTELEYTRNFSISSLILQKSSVHMSSIHLILLYWKAFDNNNNNNSSKITITFMKQIDFMRKFYIIMYYILLRK